MHRRHLDVAVGDQVGAGVAELQVVGLLAGLHLMVTMMANFEAMSGDPPWSC